MVGGGGCCWGRLFRRRRSLVVGLVFAALEGLFVEGVGVMDGLAERGTERGNG